MKKNKLPYGIPNFRKIVEENYLFVDKTPFVEQIENLDEPYLFFLRPRKFGKSLFISVLEHYYDVKYLDNFERLFGDFYIGKNPTPLHNRYLVLLFDFSGINTESKDTTFKGFLDNVISGVRRFVGKYTELFNGFDASNFADIESPEIAIRKLLVLLNQNTDKKVYLLIDEYDHFANELLSFRIDLFKELVSRTGFVRKFYEVLKTGARDGIIDRMFITGVTPITLDSFTSGFNIAKNLSLDAQFHDMLGFTENEVRVLIEIICSDCDKDFDEVYKQMTSYYNGYRFSITKDENGRLFNPNMVLYYLSDYHRYNQAPRNLIDINIASDYRKVGNLFSLLELGESKNIIEELMMINQVTGNLTIQFNLEREFDRDDLLSLMLYTGFITMDRPKANRYVFRIPNYVISELYYKYFYELLEKRYSIKVRREQLDKAIESMAYHGQIDKFVEVMQDFLGNIISNRDLIGFREGHLKIHILTLLYINGLYYIQSEFEAERGYIDIFLSEIPQFPIEYEWILELKYLRKDKMSNLEKIKEEGIEQLNRYMNKIRPQKRRVLKGELLIFGSNGKCIDRWGIS